MNPACALHQLPWITGASSDEDVECGNIQGGLEPVCLMCCLIFKGIGLAKLKCTAHRYVDGDSGPHI